MQKLTTADVHEILTMNHGLDEDEVARWLQSLARAYRAGGASQANRTLTRKVKGIPDAVTSRAQVEGLVIIGPSTLTEIQPDGTLRWRSNPEAVRMDAELRDAVALEASQLKTERGCPRCGARMQQQQISCWECTNE